MKFAECEAWVWRHRDNEVYPIGVDFHDIEDVLVPSRLPGDCVAWPKGWLEDEKRYWRASMDMPGACMPRSEIEGPSYWAMERWWKRYLEGRNKQIRKQLRRQVVRWLVGLD